MVISKQKDLINFIESLQEQTFITIDTEFLRDKTYYPKLCLVQIGGQNVEAVAIDPLCDRIDLKPLFDLLLNKRIVKVFHAARQDLEIFYNLMKDIPSPIFDTQVAAMVCGHGEQIGYNNLVNAICNVKLDKGPQYTDWSRRPLSDNQLKYALNDVIYLSEVYKTLFNELQNRGRTGWLKQEMNILIDPATYQNHPKDAWKRIKIRTTKPHVLAVLQEVSAVREIEAQRRDVPRNRVLRDETLADMAIHLPKTIEELKKVRNVPSDIYKSQLGKTLLLAVSSGITRPKTECPKVKKSERMPSDLAPVLEMLKMLLRIQASEHQVASKLIASNRDLELLAMGDTQDISTMKGWRYDVFGKEALALIEGKISLSLQNNQIQKKPILDR